MRGFADCRVDASGPLGARKRPGSLLPWLLSILFVALGAAPTRADDAGARDFVLREARAAARAAIIDLAPTPIRIVKHARPAAPVVEARRRLVVARARSVAHRHKALARHLVRAPAQTKVAALAPSRPTQPQAPTAVAPNPLPNPLSTMSAINRFTDSSLRKGDIVATEKGLRIFKGAAHFPYTEADFVALPQAGRLGRELAALDTAIVGRQTDKPRLVEAAAKTRYSLRQSLPQDVRQRRVARAEAASVRLSFAQTEKRLSTPFAAVLKESEQDREFRTASTTQPRVIGAGYIH